MKTRTLGILGICLVTALVLLLVALPVSGWRGSGPQDGAGNQCGGQMLQNGTGQGCQQAGNGNTSCIREDCPNNGTPRRDGTGPGYGQSGNGCGNGNQSGSRGQGCGGQCRG